MAYEDKMVVRLTAGQRDALDRVAHAGTHPSARRRRAQILLRAD
jgi:hypothetical protein